MLKLNSAAPISSLVVFWALRDSDAERDYWVWQSSNIPHGMLTRILKHTQELDPSLQARESSPEDCQGGFLTLDDEYGGFYLYLDGGRDAAGRPGRYLLLVGIVKRSSLAEVEIVDPLAMGLFGELAVRQPLLASVPAPQSLETSILASKRIPGHTAPITATLSATGQSPTSWLDVWRQTNEWVGRRRWLVRCRKKAGSPPEFIVFPLPELPSTSPTLSNDSPPTTHVADELPVSVRDWPPHNPWTSSMRTSFFPGALNRINLILLAFGFVGGFIVGVIFWSSWITGTSHRDASQALLNWAANYQSQQTGQLIPRQEVVERLGRAWPSNSSGLPPAETSGSPSSQLTPL
ncbi:hypothetical protein [Planctopirus hydrillae]|uniref:Uncharacterized protein n=1 Tax=Planctopirus hydrillae TaxID=1841610 RepID=A0A1C3E7E7_9PLAN|nr:hypothetical protein [Planctopirus hydrillae]ODA29175.1 hypothetical protein A6X21_09585 [Planctopirus hydrillae]